MLALIAGRGALPAAVLAARGGETVICALEQSLPDPLPPGRGIDHVFRIETLGSLLRWLRRRGVTEVCMCGAIDRPALEIRRLDLATWPLVPRVARALRKGDDGALRIVIAIFEARGFRVLAAHEAAPDLLPPLGVIGRAGVPQGVMAEALLGDAVSAEQGARDLGQACVVRGGQVLAREDATGTDAMLRGLGAGAQGGLLFKAPKPGQDRRADLPVIGPDTVRAAAQAGLRGIVLEHQGVMVIDLRRVVKLIEAEGLFLWVRERGA